MNLYHHLPLARTLSHVSELTGLPLPASLDGLAWIRGQRVSGPAAAWSLGHVDILDHKLLITATALVSLVPKLNIR